MTHSNNISLCMYEFVVNMFVSQVCWILKLTYLNYITLVNYAGIYMYFRMTISTYPLVLGLDDPFFYLYFKLSQKHNSILSQKKKPSKLLAYFSATKSAVALVVYYDQIPELPAAVIYMQRERELRSHLVKKAVLAPAEAAASGHCSSPATAHQPPILSIKRSRFFMDTLPNTGQKFAWSLLKACAFFSFYQQKWIFFSSTKFGVDDLNLILLDRGYINICQLLLSYIYFGMKHRIIVVIQCLLFLHFMGSITTGVKFQMYNL